MNLMQRASAPPMEFSRYEGRAATKMIEHKSIQSEAIAL